MLEITDNLGWFAEHSASERMLSTAAELLEMIEADAVEPVQNPGTAIVAEDLADRLESRLERLRSRDEDPNGMMVVEDAVAHLRANDGASIQPWSFEDGSGVRSIVLRSEDSEEVIACYTSRPFLESDI